MRINSFVVIVLDIHRASNGFYSQLASFDNFRVPSRLISSHFLSIFQVILELCYLLLLLLPCFIDAHHLELSRAVKTTHNLHQLINCC